MTLYSQTTCVGVLQPNRTATRTPPLRRIGRPTGTRKQIRRGSMLPYQRIQYHTIVPGTPYHTKPYHTMPYRNKQYNTVLYHTMLQVLYNITTPLTGRFQQLHTIMVHSASPDQGERPKAWAKRTQQEDGTVPTKASTVPTGYHRTDRLSPYRPAFTVSTGFHRTGRLSR